jgi:hypothetical protein
VETAPEKHILVVDDDAGTRDALGGIVLDLSMPVMDGLRSCSRPSGSWLVFQPNDLGTPGRPDRGFVIPEAGSEQASGRAMASRE